MYEIRVKKLKSSDGKFVANNLKISHTTAMTPCYCSITPIQTLVDVFGIPTSTILFFIRQASRQADYINGGPIDTSKGVPYVVEKFTEIEATIEALTKAYVISSNDSGLEGTLGKISFKNGTKLSGIKNLLDVLRRQAKQWKEAIRGYEFEGRNRIAFALKSNRTLRATPVNIILDDYTRNGNLGKYWI